MEQSVPDQPIADDIAADAEEAGGSKLVLLAILVGGAKDRLIKELMEVGQILIEQLLKRCVQCLGWVGGDCSRERCSGVRRRQPQVFGTDDIAGADQQRTVHDIFQLANVAGPGIVEQ